MNNKKIIDLLVEYFEAETERRQGIHKNSLTPKTLERARLLREQLEEIIQSELDDEVIEPVPTSHRSNSKKSS
jgi:hypothetical protein